MSAGRVAAFGSGWVALTVALVSPVDVYADVSFTVHMVQHLVLTLVAPPLLALGPRSRWRSGVAARPGQGARRRVALAAGSMADRPGRWLMLFVGVPVIVHASRLFDLALRSTGWHALEHGVWIVAALVYWWPIVGADPSPHPMRYPVRMLSMLLTMPAVAFLSLAIYSADAPLYSIYAALPAPWGPDALADQRAAAVLMWLAGNLVMVVAMLLVAASWKHHDDEVQRRREAREDAMGSPAGVFP